MNTLGTRIRGSTTPSVPESESAIEAVDKVLNSSTYSRIVCLVF